MSVVILVIVVMSITINYYTIHLVLGGILHD